MTPHPRGVLSAAAIAVSLLLVSGSAAVGVPAARAEPNCPESSNSWQCRDDPPPPPTTTPPPTTQPSTTVAPTTTVQGPTTTTPAGLLFVDDFDVPADMDRYDWQLFHGGTFTDPNTIPDAPKSWWGDHDNLCSPPPGPAMGVVGQRREVHVHAANADPGPTGQVGEMAWWCAPGNDPTRGHFMSAIDSQGYSSLSFAVPQALSNVRRICWDMSLNDVAGWWLQLDVIPEAVFQANGRDQFYESPGLGAEVAFNAHNLTAGSFMFEVLRGSTHAYTAAPGGLIDDPNFVNVLSIPGFPTHDRAKRYRHCITDLENGTVRAELFDRTAAGSVETRNHRGAIPNGPVRVIFEHSSYHNAKDTAHYDTLAQDGKTLGDELTVHWDNVRIES